jgi:N-acyl-D-amino-acid deacylase
MGRASRHVWLLAFAACSSAEPVVSSAPSPPASAVASADSSPAEALATPPFRTNDRVDLVLRNGNVCDGSGKPCRVADVAISGDRIVHVGTVDARQPAGRFIDVRGLVVAPGYIDAHAHTDPFGSVDHLLAMGVTTIVVGQDGNSPDERIKSYLDRVDASRPRVNVATLVGHATVRSQEGLGMKAPLDEAEIGRMAARVEKAMEEGAFGLSTGLEYDPGSAAGPVELAGIAMPVGKRGGVVMSHLRSEDDDKVEAAIDELLAQCEASKAKAHVAHIKVVLGKGEARAKKVLDQLQRARDRGMTVTADVYPYIASYTTVAILFPAYARPPNNYRAALTQKKKQLLEDLKKRVTARNGPDAMRFGTGKYAGRTLAEAARAEGRPFEALLAELGPSGGSAAYKVMDDDVVTAFVMDPFVMFGTDGSATSPHPRGAGTFAQVMGYRQWSKLPLEELVRKASALPARTLGFDRRGTLEPGAAADVIVLEEAEVASPATLEAPQARARGMRFVIVNGVIAWADGKADGRAGKALRAR